MKTKTIKLYQFDELSEEQKAKVIEKHQDINTFDGWSDWLLEDEKDKLSRQGFKNAKIYYSGFWSQGDGASFSADVDLEQFLKGRRIATKYAKALKLYQDSGDNVVIDQGGHYCHEYTMSINSDNLSDELEAFILEEAREQARSVYQALRSTYESLTSDEEIADTLRANEYYFNSENLEIDS